MEKIDIISGKHVNKEQIMEALKLDFLSYNEVYHLNEVTCEAYHKKNPYIYFIAWEKEFGKVIGYINFSPISEECYSRIRTGEIMDTEITEKDIVVYEVGKAYCAYFSSIVVHPDYRKKGIAERLLLEVEKFRIKKNIEGEFCKKIIADVISEQGMRIAESLGMSVVCKSKHDSLIMEVKYE